MFRVYVGNLPYPARDGDLKAFFEKAGCSVTESTVVMMPDGRSKGFGFVSFADEESFKKAQALSGGEMDGRSIRIDAARPKEDRGSMGGDRPMMDRSHSSAPKYDGDAAMDAKDEEVEA